MKFLYYLNLSLLGFSITVLAGVARYFSAYPSLFYTSLGITFFALILGVLPYRVRVRNPLALEFLTILISLFLGGLTWF